MRDCVSVPTFRQHGYRHDASDVASRWDSGIYIHLIGEGRPCRRNFVARPTSLSDCRKDVSKTLALFVLHLAALQLFHYLRIDPNRSLAAVLIPELRDHGGRVSFPDKPLVYLLR